MWVTVFVIDQKEHLSDKDFPAFQVGGKLFLYMRDSFSDDSVAVGFVIDNLIFDLYAEKPKQYVHLTKIMR
jgi:hypothetical protein